MCCCYWMKYANHEARLATVDKVEKVYERAIKFMAYSVEFGCIIVSLPWQISIGIEVSKVEEV